MLLALKEIILKHQGLYFMRQLKNKYRAIITIVFMVCNSILYAKSISGTIPYEQIDSVEFYMPEYEGRYFIECNTRKSFVDEIRSGNIKAHFVRKRTDAHVLSSIENALRSAEILEELPYDASEILMHLKDDVKYNNTIPYIWDDCNDMCVRGCLIIYSGSQSQIVWLGLDDIVDVSDLRVKCEIYKILLDGN